MPRSRPPRAASTLHPPFPHCHAEDTAGAAALPVGGFFTPLAAGVASSASLPREPPPPCSSCGALATSHSVWAARGWGCAVCARLNDYASAGHVRYARAADRQALPELLSDAHEVLLPFPGDEEEEEEELGVEEKENGFQPTMDDLPGTINIAALTFLVLDAAGEAKQLEDVRDSVITLLESMPASSRVVLVVFSDEVHCVMGGLEAGRDGMTAEVDASSTRTPSPDSLDSTGSQLVSLLREAQGLSLERALLAPAQALTALSRDGFFVALGRAEPRPRALGRALQALLGLVARSGRAIAEARCESARDRQLLRASGLPPCIGARLMLFLTGAPNLGLGACDLGQEVLDVPEQGTPAEQRQTLTSEDAFLLDASFPEVSAWAAAGAAPSSALPRAREELEGDSRLPWCAADESYCQEDSDGEVPQLFRPNFHAPALYASAGTTAASLGVVVDAFALQAASRASLCLPLWAGLAENSGGRVFFYPGGYASTLVQDLCRRQQQAVAARCMLRIRAPEELQVLVHASGRCWADA
ncbi:hypothetical protein H632_c522p0, partial [Helicosporidium sp. ATCC 50920]